MENNSPHFLVVDDDPIALDIISTILVSLGCSCDCVASAQQVIEKLKSPGDASKFDAIFIDVLMPEMNGLELAQKLQENAMTQNIPRVMVTSLGKYDEVIKGYQSGSDYYMTKPIDKEQITYALDLLFGEHEEEDTKKSFDLPEA